MNFEKRIVEFVCRTEFDELPDSALDIVKKMVLADIGTTIAGAYADGCRELVDFYRHQGGLPEASLLIHGGKVPAQNAAMVNAVMSRALDFCDAIAPGPHIGSSVIPAALACSELKDGCSGEEFLTALTLGAEIAARMNLSESAYDGFDPTGICVPFGATATACRLLHLNEQQTWDALAAVFNRCGGSFQSHIDGSLGVRVNQGWVAHDGVASARFSAIGISGPKNFIEGIYGYLHLYGKHQFSAAELLEGLGTEFRLMNVAFKKYPSCAMTAGPTDLMLGILKNNVLNVSDITAVKVSLPPYGYRLVGHEFRIGDNPTVDGQFSASYCIANVLLRGGSSLQHFTSASVRDPEIQKLIPMISVQSVPELDHRGHTATDIEITTIDGNKYRKRIDIAPGFPGNPLTEEDHLTRFWDCIDFGSQWITHQSATDVLELIQNLENIPDIRELITILNRNTDTSRDLNSYNEEKA